MEGIAVSRRFKAPTSSAGRRRRQSPRVSERGGLIAFECPFCFPPHPLVVDQEASCGTMLELTAVQRLYRGVRCAKCGQPSGTLTKLGDDYQHTYDCVPGKMLLPEEPVPSRWARIVYSLPMWLRRPISRRRQQVAMRVTREERIIYTWVNA
jgi:hypothetical protein